MDLARISGIQFSVIKQNEVRRISCMEVKNSSMSSNKRNTLIDDRLGTLNSLKTCPTCSNFSDKCSGHFGKIELKDPVINPFFSSYLLQMIKNFCFQCMKKNTRAVTQKNRICTYCDKQISFFIFRESRLYKDKNEIKHKELYSVLKTIPDTIWKTELHFTCTLNDLFIETLLVPPMRIRPYNNVLNIKHHDECTTKLLQVVKSRGNDSEIYQNLASYIFQDSITKSRGRSSHSLESKSIASRWKGKKGRVRGNLMGKRINFTARSVISPGPDIKLNEVGVPQKICNILTKVEYITAYNIFEWQSKVNCKHKSIQFVEREDGKRILVKKSKVSLSLRIGWKIFRSLRDGDWVLMNRQPTLHRHSIMAHRVKVVPTNTLQLNLSVTTPYNADFDGDEMNLHCIQGLDAEAEAQEIIEVCEQLGSNQSSSLTMALVQDSLLGIYLLSKKNNYFNLVEVSMFLEAHEIPLPTILKPEMLWSGKDIISTIIPPYISFVTADTVIKKGKILKGETGKNVFGTKGLLYDIYIMEGGQEASNIIMRLQKLARVFLDMSGVCVTPRLLMNMNIKQASLKQEHLNENDEVLLKYTQEITSMSLRKDHKDAVECMVQSGSKGKSFNLMQIKGSVGQQIIMGRMFSNEFPCNISTSDKVLQKKSFIKRSYALGLKEDEYFLHCMSGREGIIDTSVKTADTGYLHRKITKSMESFVVQSDNTVRGHGHYIVQFKYGSDSLDCSRLFKISVSFAALERFYHMCSSIEEFRALNRYVHCFAGKSFRKFYLPFKPYILCYDFSCTNPQLCGRNEDTLYTTVVDAFKDWEKEKNLVSDIVFAYIAYTLCSENRKKLNICQCNVSTFLRRALASIHKAQVQAGEMVGMIAVGSVSEPCTQMTLNTFHSCGVGNTTVSVGIPRLKDIMDCKITSNITLIVSDKMYRLYTAYLVLQCKAVKDIFSPISVPASMTEIILFSVKSFFGSKVSASRLNVRAYCLKEEYQTKKKEEIRGCRNVVFLLCRKNGFYLNFITPFEFIVVTHTDCDFCNLKVSQVSFKQGTFAFTRERFHPSYSSILLNAKDVSELIYENIISSANIHTRDIHTALSYFGLETANRCIFDEISEIISGGGDVNPRHIMLLADAMTMHGFLHGFNRHALQKINSVNAFEHATFEQTIDVFKKAALQSSQFKLSSTSDTVFCGEQFYGGGNCVDMITEKMENKKGEQPVQRSLIRTIIRKEWSSLLQPEDDALSSSCPLSPEYCPVSPEYIPSDVMDDNDENEIMLNYALKRQSEASVIENTVCESIDMFRNRYFSGMSNIFLPPSPCDNDETSRSLNFDLICNALTPRVS